MPSAPQPSAVAETITLATAGEVDSLLRALARAPAPSRRILPELQPGERLGHYQVIERLGQGSMGVVYRALDIKLARDVALKLVATATAEASDELRQVAREAQALAALAHPNVVTVYSLEATEDVVFITMALVAGESLRQRMGGGPLARAEVLRGARELARGLAAAHARGIIHRDVKPENVRIGPSGSFVLLDFGLARFTAHDSAPPSARPIDPADSNVVTAIAGTPAYMAPEQRRGEPIDARVDVWALGLVILEMATGRRDREPADLARLPRSLRAVVARCLELEPAQRFSDAGTLLEALEPSTRRGPIVAAVCCSPPPSPQ